MRRLCHSGYAARIRRRQNTGHIPGKKSAANKRVYTVYNFLRVLSQFLDSFEQKTVYTSL